MDQNLYAGETLKSFLERRGRLEPSVLLKMMEPAARELALLHREGKIHGNIRPETMSIASRLWFCCPLPENAGAEPAGGGVPVSLGWPTSCAYPAEERDGGYFPLEACVDRSQIGSWSDVYSLCAVMYEALTGQSVPAIKEWIGGADLVSPSALGIRNVPPRLEDGLRRGLSIRWKDRPRDGAELYQLLWVSQAGEVKKLPPRKKENSKKNNGPKKRKSSQEQIRYFGIKRAKKIFRNGLPQIVSIPEKTDVILPDAFQSVVFPEKWVKVRKIIIPESVREIQEHALWQLEAEETVVVPEGTARIGADAFRLGEAGYITCTRGTKAYEYCRENHLRSSVDMEEWRREGRCQYCGGRISFFAKTCGACGRRKDY